MLWNFHISIGHFICSPANFIWYHRTWRPRDIPIATSVTKFLITHHHPPLLGEMSIEYWRELFSNIVNIGRLGCIMGISVTIQNWNFISISTLQLLSIFGEKFNSYSNIQIFVSRIRLLIHCHTRVPPMAGRLFSQ